MASLSDHLPKERLREILDQCANLKIGVIGDIALDGYWYADMTRSFLSRETPRYPRPIVREGFSPGAGANVANNLKALDVGKVVVFSIVGEDWRQKILSDMLTSCGISTQPLIRSPERSTTTYIKPILMGYDSQQEDARLDFENDSPLSPALEDTLLAVVQKHLPSLDTLLVADQLEINGIVTDRVREGLNDLAAKYTDTRFLVDSRQRIGLFKNMTLKPNRIEAAQAVCPDRDYRSVDNKELPYIGQALSEQAGGPVFVTLSEEGVLVCAAATHRFVPAAPVRPPLDVCGAGDAFIAALGAAISAGATPWEAGAVANLASAVVVEKLHQTGTSTPDEILTRYNLATQKDTGYV